MRRLGCGCRRRGWICGRSRRRLPSRRQSGAKHAAAQWLGAIVLEANGALRAHPSGARIARQAIVREAALLVVVLRIAESNHLLAIGRNVVADPNFPGRVEFADHRVGGAIPNRVAEMKLKPLRSVGRIARHAVLRRVALTTHAAGIQDVGSKRAFRQHLGAAHQ